MLSTLGKDLDSDLLGLHQVHRLHTIMFVLCNLRCISNTLLSNTVRSIEDKEIRFAESKRIRSVMRSALSNFSQEGIVTIHRYKCKNELFIVESLGVQDGLLRGRDLLHNMRLSRARKAFGRGTR